MPHHCSKTKRALDCGPRCGDAAGGSVGSVSSAKKRMAAPTTLLAQPLSHSHSLTAAAAVVQAAQANPNDPVAYAYDFRQPQIVDQNSANIANGSSMSSLDMSAGTQQAPNCVLRVIIENMIYPVTLDVLYSYLEHLYTFQALIQISEATAAQNAKQSLDGQNVYNGCCTLRIDYSKLSTLNIKFNNDKSRDYTNPNLPSGEMSLEQQLAISAIPGLQSLLPQAAPFSYSFGAANANTIFSQAAAAAAGEAQALNAFVPSLGGIGASISPALSTLRFPVGILAPTNVILVSNLDENKVTTDGLFTLFGVYGDVVRVKILYNKKDNALIQYAEPQQAQLAIQHLDKARWHDRLIRVTASRHTSVQMPKEGKADLEVKKVSSNIRKTLPRITEKF
ncbi:hypothetical protein WR25_03093 isoform B [Diploscapter pachys]|uniref:RRM domain-containing protein n=1 Tax=Diploscapter pachys TaxID=2018661 RepID=A0A2A2L648_9BILA|nr:hypothetical protein WR25_03093 isoform A [Diploscapter pachys]PAV81608.1 hypothetical protein WR25_03093 isoform B [Diploscapter pachys]